MESTKRKPLSDITKIYDLTPTSDLRERIAASTSKSFSKPPISISRSNSGSTSRKFFSESSSKSNTSIGSSNVGAPLDSKKTVRFRSPAPSISSITTPGKQREIGRDITGDSPCSLEKINVEKEGIIKYSRTSTVKSKETGLECLNHSGFFVERGKDKGKPLNTCSSSQEKTREKGKAILRPTDIVERTQSAKDKRKQREIGRDITGDSPCSLEKINVEKEGIIKYSRTSTVKNKETGLECLNHSGFFVERGKDKGKPLNTCSSSQEKTREKGKAILQPTDIVETTQSAKDKSKPPNTFKASYEKTKEKGKQKLQHSDIVEVAEHIVSFDSVAGKSRPSRRKSEKRKIDSGASSCPPMTRPKSIQYEFVEGGDKSSKTWDNPRPKHRKRIEQTCELPRDFIEQKKAYFKEIDDFELVEEEATPDEVD